MKKGLIFQLFITLILIISWNFIHLGFEYSKGKIFQKASTSELIIFAESYNNLQKLNQELKQVYYIENTTVLSDTTIADELITEYDLGDVRDILVSYNLPNIMTILFDGRTFRISEKNEFTKFLEENYPEIIVNFDEEFWQNQEKELVFAKKSYYLANIVFILLLLFIITFMRIHFEIKHNDFWQIFKSAGGKYNKRSLAFLSDSLLLSSIPMILITATYYTLFYKGILLYEIDYRIFITELAALILSALLARTALWSKF